jgi:glucose-6-phosphate-specific signal transduction histidine kinase
MRLKGIIMKIVILASLLASVGTVNAAVYKCESGSGAIEYQASPCNNQFQSKKLTIIPIAPGKVKRAQEKLAKELKQREELAQQLAEVNRRERDVRAKELSARAELDIAYETRRQTEAIEDNTRAVNQNSWGGYYHRRGYQYY